MHLQDGKNFEKLLVGLPANSLKEHEFQMAVVEHGIGKIRNQLRSNLEKEMQKTRESQQGNPSIPKNIFAKNLVMDIDEAMGDITEQEEGERYDIRFYSSVDTQLDYVGSFDCWVEIFDKKLKKVLADYKIDITSNPNKTMPGNYADAVYYFDPAFNNDELMGKLDTAIFDSEDYKTLVRNASKTLIERAHIQYQH